MSAAVSAKCMCPELEICVVEKGQGAGHHNLSGAALEAGPLHELLDMAMDNWREDEKARKILARKCEKDDVMFMATSKLAFNIHWKINIARAMKLNLGQMYHKGDYIVSISELTVWLADIARSKGIEILEGFAVEDIIIADDNQKATGVKLVDQGLGHDGEKLPNYMPGEVITADFIILAEGCDGLVTETFIQKAGLERQHQQLYSLGVKEVIKVSDRQYEMFGGNRAVHALGWPIFIPPVGPDMFGGGVMYPMGDNKIAVGMIVGLDWKYKDFNTQDALVLFKSHPFVNKFIEGGTVVEAGAKMIPEAGYYALPRDPATGTIGRSNVLITGDSAGFVNMIKIKGLHNAIASGMLAGKAVSNSLETPCGTARMYTKYLDESDVIREMKQARHFRQTVGKFGPMFGLPASVLNGLLPNFTVEPDYECMKDKNYKLRPDRNFDKDTFTAMARTEHREEQPSHLKILDPEICRTRCTPKYNSPCITFCPAGVYETIHDEVKSANPSNCLHCKTCQRKCPFDNIRWTVPEGGGGPRYQTM